MGGHPSGRPGRPWLTIIEDNHSRAVAGYAVNLGAPSALTTALVFRQAIWRKPWPRWHVCGIPDAFHVDHGSDFTSAHLEQVRADLRTRAYFSLPGQPRGRQAFRLLDVVPVPQQAMASRTIVYTPKVHNTPRIVDKEITFLHERLSWGIEWELQTRRISPS